MLFTACVLVLQEVCVLSLLVCLCYRKFVCYRWLYVCVTWKFVTCPNFTHWFMLRRELGGQPEVASASLGHLVQSCKFVYTLLKLVVDILMV